MKNNLEIILDTNPSGGCGCNCGCGGANTVEDMNSLVEDLKVHKFEKDLSIDVYPISNWTNDELINKINTLLDNTNATFRVDSDNLDETMSNILPLIALDGNILTAYGVPRLQDVANIIKEKL